MLTCCIIGETSLTERCGDSLIQAGYNILAVVSNNVKVQQWASAHSIRIFTQLRDFQQALASFDFDLLFSIVNSQVLHADLLKKPRIFAVNFHDALLPTYGGLYATTWTIFNREKTHGITWHVMTTEIDGGDILKQVTFPIAADETALSLNIKCYEHAHSSFESLLPEITHNTFHRVLQDQTLRTYYPRDHRFKHNGIIHWSDTAEDIDRTIRALNFGTYTNPVSLPKIVIGEKFFIIRRHALERLVSAEAPGTIVDITDAEISIATSQYNIVLKEVVTLQGDKFPLSQLIAKFKLEKGRSLVVNEALIQTVSQSCAAIEKKHENFWVNILRACIDCEQHALLKRTEELGEYTLSTLSEVRGHEVLASILIYLYRLNNYKAFVVWMSNSMLRQYTGVSKSLLSSKVPVKIELKPNMSLEEVLTYTSTLLTKLSTHKTFETEIFTRYGFDSTLLPLDIFIDTEDDDSELEFDRQPTLQFEIGKDEVSIIQYRQGLHYQLDKTALDNILQQMQTNVTCSISKLVFIAHAEYQQQVISWNQTTSQFPTSNTLVDLFAAQATAHPEAIAVTEGDIALTYAELNSAANRLAHYLRHANVGCETLVAVVMPRSIELIITILGILKAGGAYVPLDVEYPTARLQLILKDTRTPLLITQSHYRAKVSEYQGSILCLDEMTAILNAAQETNLTVINTPESLAYIIYTSGSTGDPKGVMVEHRSINRLVKDTNYIALGATDRVAHASSPAFDAATFEIWGALLNGGTCVIVPQAIVLSPVNFAEFFRAKNITLLWLTSALFNQLVRDCPRAVADIMQVMVGGEALDRETINVVLREGAPQRLLNGYGPTENTTFTTTYAIQAPITVGRTVPLGRPISNTTVYILDTHLQLMPIGVVGELCVGGAGLARGYWQRPDLTEEAFIAHPFCPGERLYKTGDLARYLPDGQIEFLGRIDTQIKLRGFRIELREIETALQAMPAIKQAVVLLREDIRQQKKLVAYVTVNSNDEGSQTTLMAQMHATLSQTLPSYMLPSALVVLANFPLTYSGKINYLSLPAPDNDALLHRHYVSPETFLEQQLVSIWQEILQRPQLGIRDNFFCFGGDSILAIQTVSAARKRAIHFTVQDIFNVPTIDRLAEHIHRQIKVPQPQSFQGKVLGQSPLTPIQHWFFEQNLSIPHHFNQSQLLQFAVHLDPTRVEQTLQCMIVQHDVLRSRFYRVEGHWVQDYAQADTQVPFCVLELSSADVAVEINQIVQSMQTCLDLRNGPLFKVALVSNPKNNQQSLLWVMHHLIVDGVSWRILIQQFCDIYLNPQVIIPAKTFAYRDWAVMLQEYAQTVAIEKEWAYWLKPVDVVALPQDVVKSGVPGRQKILKQLSRELTQQLLHEVPKAYATQINDVLLTALVQTFQRWTGCDSVYLNLEGHGRETIMPGIDLSATVGWFTAIFPVWLSVANVTDKGAQLKTIKEQLRAIPQRGIGYGILRYLSKQQDKVKLLAHGPSPQISFNYLGQWRHTNGTGDQMLLHANSIGENVSAENQLADEMAFVAVVVDECFQLEVDYRSDHYHQQTIEAIVDGYIATLKTLIAYCCHESHWGYTPSDFPLARISQPALDAIAQRYGRFDELYPLSPLQQGLWFRSQYMPASDEYFVQTLVELRGDVNPELLRASWHAVIETHTFLQTAVVWHGLEQPLQLIGGQCELPWQLLDWRDVPEQEKKLTALLAIDRQQGFNLAQPPLFRLRLIRMSEVAYTLVWSQHHILIDGWSLPRILKDVLTSYCALSVGQCPRLLKGRPYRDYIDWLQHQDTAAEQAFWRTYFADLQEPTTLKLAQPLHPVAEHGTEVFTLNPVITAQLKVLAQSHDVTLNVVLQTMWGILLSHYCNQENIVFGVTHSGRGINLSGVDEMVGLFINTLPFWLPLNKSLAASTIFKDVQQKLAAVSQYTYTPLFELQQRYRQSHFETLFVFENYPITETLHQPQGDFTLTNIRNIEKVEYPLTVVVLPGKTQLSIQFDYQRQRFDVQQIQQLAQHFLHIIQQVLTYPEQPLHQLQLLTADEYQHQIVDWNQTQRAFPQDKTVIDVFVEQLLRHPEAIAIVDGEITLTYAALNTAANQWAHYLRSIGVEHETLVTLALPRSKELIIGMLAILKAGGAYVPLDVDSPDARLEFLLQDTNAPVLITRSEYRHKFNQFTGTLICADTVQLMQQPSTNLAQCSAPASLAYIIYTSGSTGKPKGVMIEHRGINRLVKNTNYIEFSSRDRVAHISSPAFDAATFEIWGALLNGSASVIVPPEIVLSSPQLIAYLRAQCITIALLAPAVLNQLIRDDVQAVVSLEQLLVGGEALDTEIINTLIQHGKPGRLINAYGPTESTTIATTYEIHTSIPKGKTTPLGTPIANTQVYILDRHLHPVPIGVSGELCISGVGLARGYWQRADLTARTFVTNPFDPVARLYKTGDLARYLPDGRIEFLGRIDHQIKLRGYRIELGEIEATLKTVPGIVDVVVVLREDKPTEKKLVAYLVVQSVQQSAEVIALSRAAVARVLPHYMVPSAFVLLDKIPLTYNSKIDRLRLPSPDRNAHISAHYVPPQTPLEHQLVKIWHEILGVTPIGITDDFFDLGGHSLLAQRLAAKILHGMGADINVRTIFEHPTIEQLSLFILNVSRTFGRRDIPAITVADRTQPAFPLSYAQKRLWIIEQIFPGNNFYHIPVALRLTGNINLSALTQAFNALVQRHESLRTVFKKIDNELKQIILPPQELLLNVVVLPDDTDVTTALTAEALRPFDLTASPLFRVRLIQCGMDTHILQMTLHHIIADGWSMDVFFNELSEYYRAFNQHVTPLLSVLPIQYADFSVWQRQWLQGDILLSQLHYWQTQLAGFPMQLTLPTDHVRPKILRYAGKTHDIQLYSDERAQLANLSQQYHCSGFMTLLTLFSVLLHRYSGQEDIAIGSPFANRHYAKTEGIIGFFVNTLVLRSHYHGNSSFVELLQHMRTTVLDAQISQDLPFEQLVDSLQVERAINRHPLFQVMFAYQPLGEETARFSDVRVSRVDVPYEIAKFDLTLLVKESVDGLTLSFEYSQDLFEHATIVQLANHFQQLMMSVLANPTQALGTIPLLSAAEYQQQIETWNQTHSEYPQDSTVVDLFTAQVTLHPDAIAVKSDDGIWTYTALNTEATRLSHYLRRVGVTHETPVALALPRSVEFIIGMLGILKAGGTYVPLDVEAPAQRLQWMLQDSAAEVLITRSEYRAKFSQYSAITLCLDEAQAVLAQQELVNPLPVTTADSLAYIMYTSGSTGKPKGVMIEHRGIIRLVTATNYLTFTTDSRVAHAASPAFDAATFEIWGPLLNGGSCVIVTAETVLSPGDFASWLRSQSITVLWLTASLFNQLVRDCPSIVAGIAHVIVGGEALNRETINTVLTQGAPLHLLNGYGPTENTTFTTTYEITAPIAVGKTVPLGRPIANTTVYILDPYLQPVPIGVAGELYIGGAGLARGYWCNPELTREAFVVVPFHNNQRLYKTGDRVRYLPDATIEFLGRNDHQIKLRGYRIELGEIEARLQAIPGIEDAMVVCRGEGGQQRIVAYVQAPCDAARREERWVTDIRASLTSSLPTYMIPSAFIVLEKFPLTLNGKINRLALPVPDVLTVTNKQYAPPRTPLEQQLVQIWQDILKVSRVGIRDNFFFLGGDSILAIQASSAAQTQAIYFSVQDIFTAPTVAQLALRAVHTEPVIAAVPMQDASGAQLYPLSPLQAGFLFRAEYAPASDEYFVQTLLQLQGNVDAVLLQASWQAVMETHTFLQTGIVWRGLDRPLQWIDAEVELPWQLLDWRDALNTESKIAAFIAADRTQGFDLAKPPLFRLRLIRLSETNYTLIWSQHHILIDGWSLPIILKAVFATYAALRAGKEPSLSPGRPYRDYIAWLQQQDRQAEAKYWGKYFAGLDETCTISLPSPENPNPVHCTLELSLTLEDSTQLRALAQSHSVTLNAVLQTMWGILLSHYCNQNNVVFGVTHSGRSVHFPGIEQMVGVFINTLPCWMQINAGDSFLSLLHDVHQKSGEISQYTYTPLFELQQRYPHTNFETLFVFENYPIADILSQQGDLTVTGLSGVEKAEYPLTVVVGPGTRQISIKFDYQQQRFDAIYIEKLAQHFQQLIQQVLAHPEVPLQRLQVLTAGEYQQQTVDWNQTQQLYPAEATVIDLFVAEVQRCPEAIALVEGESTLTYAALNVAANQWAHYLRSIGVGNETLVTLALPRSKELIIAMLAILKAGGAYVPLDVDSPESRLQFLLQDTSAPVLITRSEYHHKFNQYAGTVICADTVQQMLAQQGSANPAQCSTPTNLAYIIYTSGSTGKPKGVMIEHRGINRLVKNTNYIEFNHCDRVAHISSPAFDAATFEIWGALLNGSTSVIVPPDVVLSSAQLIAYLRTQRITIALLAPALLNQLIRDDVRAVQSIEQLLVGGEALDRETINTIIHKGRPRRLINAYGPTESTTIATTYEILMPIPIGRSVPLGTPIANTQVYILDQHLQPAPVGVAGELCISGVGLARGYWQRLDLTQRAFIDNPFNAETRLYKTGDLARYLPDGRIEFLGRIDHQIKLRGYRIELGEIEATLKTVPGIVDAVVALREDKLTEKKISGLSSCAIRARTFRVDCLR